MGIAVMVMGESGTGKSASLRSFKLDEVGIINVNNKPLPFKNEFKTIATDNYDKILNIINRAKANVVVIDDSQYLMANEFMNRARETGYQKFTDIGYNFWNLVKTVSDLPDNRIVYFLHHSAFDEFGRQRVKTIGRLLDDKITVEGMFSIVLKTVVHDGNYYFSTQNSGYDTVKTPMGMFPEPEIENDLKAVDTRIREYYGIA